MSYADLLEYYPSWVDYRRWYLRVPGVQVGIRQGRELRVASASGTADLTTGAPLTSAHLFRVASHSKTFTAVITLQLAEQGRLRLDDTLASHLPELAGSPLAERTLHELLTHSGGVVRDSTDGDFWQHARPFPDRDELMRIAAEPSADVIDANEHFKYSNIGYGLVGTVVEKVTGQTFDAAVRAAVIERLALADTGTELDPLRRDDYAAPHTGLTSSRERVTLEHVDTRALAAATGCYATAADLTAFFAALLPGDDRLLNPRSQRLLRHPHWQIKQGERAYGLGVFLDTVDGVELFGHTGGYPGHITATMADVERGWVVSVLTNCVDGQASELASAFFRLAHLAREATHAECGPEGVRFTGRFASLWGVYDVVRLDGRLFGINAVAGNPAEDAVPLEVVGPDALRISGGRGGNSYGELMRFEFSSDGAVSRVRGESAMTLTPFQPPPTS